MLFERLVKNTNCRFPQKGQQLDVPNEQGVYIIRDADSVVVHVGRTLRGKGGLRQPLYNHLNCQSSFCHRCLKSRGYDLRKQFTFSYLIVANDRERALLEHLATAFLSPKHLGLGAASTG
jgi:hypothetical protein